MASQNFGSSIIQSILEGAASAVNENSVKKQKKKDFEEQSNVLLDRKLREDQAIFNQNLKQKEQALPSQLAALKQTSDFNFAQAQEQKAKKREAMFGKKGPDGKYSGGSLSDVVNNNPRRAENIMAAMEGIKVPMPALPQVAQLTAQGKYQEAWNLSEDPIDREHVMKAVEFHNAVNKGDRAGVPTGYQRTDDGSGVEPIPGAPVKGPGGKGGSKRTGLPSGYIFGEDGKTAVRIPGLPEKGAKGVKDTSDKDVKEMIELLREDVDENGEVKPESKAEIEKLQAKRKETLRNKLNPAAPPKEKPRAPKGEWDSAIKLLMDQYKESKRGK